MFQKYYVDLHVHSTASDGKYSPTEIVAIAKEKNLKAIALTDHDTIDGLEDFSKEGKKLGIETIFGVEIETHEKELNFFEIHIVGLFIDSKNVELKNLLEDASKQRDLQKEKMIKKISGLGYQISLEDVKKISKGEIGRPHIAKILLEKNPEKFDSISDVFNKLLTKGKPGFVEREEVINFKQAIDAIHSAKGLAFFAHPLFFDDWKEIIKKFVECDGDGVESFVAYPNNLKNLEESKVELKKIIQKYGLLQSGGTDFHGTKSWECQIGGLNIPYSIVEEMKNKCIKNSIKKI